MQPEDAALNEILGVTRMCAQIILENGGEAYRAEDTVFRICRAFGYDKADVIALPIGVFITVGKDGSFTTTAVRRIKKHTVDLSAIDEVNNISRSLSCGAMSLPEASQKLSGIATQKRGNKSFMILAAGISSGLFALLFKGSVFDFIVAALCGMIVRFVANFLSSDDMFNFAMSILGGVIIGVIAILSTKVVGMGDFDKIITGALMPLLPGISMTNAIRDTMRGDIVSGVAGCAQAILTAVALAFGIGLVLEVYYILVR